MLSQNWLKVSFPSFFQTQAGSTFIRLAVSKAFLIRRHSIALTGACYFNSKPSMKQVRKEKKAHFNLLWVQQPCLSNFWVQLKIVSFKNTTIYPELSTPILTICYWGGKSPFLRAWPEIYNNGNFQRGRCCINRSAPLNKRFSYQRELLNPSPNKI